MATFLLTASNDGVRNLRLESDDGFPRLELRVMREIAAQVQTLAAGEFEGCVISGADTAFAVGADITELVKLSPSAAFEFSRAGQRVMQMIECSRVPVVAAIRGYCMGGGLDLALACHSRIATPDAVFAHPGGALGILTGWGGTQRLARLIGRSRALEILTTGVKLTAQESLNCGLISEIAPASVLNDASIRRMKYRIHAGRISA